MIFFEPFLLRMKAILKIQSWSRGCQFRKKQLNIFQKTLNMMKKPAGEAGTGYTVETTNYA